MPEHISTTKRDGLIHDLIHADFDLTVIQSKYGLTPDSLSRWVLEEANHRCLTGLCVLADIQTQILLSRYRLHAAVKLYQLASLETEDDKAVRDIVRRACVDLLKLDLRRADTDADYTAGGGDFPPDDSLQFLRELIHPTLPDNSSHAQAPDEAKAGAAERHPREDDEAPRRPGTDDAR